MEGTNDMRADVPEKDRSWMRLLAFAGFVVVVAGVYAVLMRDAYHPKPSSGNAFNAAIVDDFNRPRNESGLGTASGGHAWKSVSGLWMIDAGKAVIGFPDKNTSLAIVGPVKGGAISANVTGKARCGVVARYVDARNYLSFEFVPQYAVWNIVAVRDGNEVVLGKMLDPGGSTSALRLETGARVITAHVGLESTTVVDPSTVTSGWVGFIGHDAGSSACTWDDMWVYEGK
jgi:hypothetical protein